jgi:hypothetical protein
MNEDRDQITHGPVLFVPVIHGRLEFALTVRRLFYDYQPEAVAVELPDTIQTVTEKGLDRLPYLSVVMYEEKDGRTVYLPLEPQDPIVAAAHLARTHGLPLHFIDRDTEGYPRTREAFPDSYALTRLGLREVAENYRRIHEDDSADPEDELREMTMAFRLQKIAADHDRVMCVLGMSHWHKVQSLLDQSLTQPLARRKRSGVALANLHHDSAREILTEPPFLAAAFVRSGRDGRHRDIDRLAVHRDLVEQARTRHLERDKTDVGPHLLAAMYKFARNYALVQNYLTPDLYQLLVAARGVGGDNFAYQVWDVGTDYPWQDDESNLPTLRLRGEDLYLDTRRIRFYRGFRRNRRRLIPVPVKKRRRENRPGEWKETWDGRGICSFQPEDIVIENFGDYLKKKTVQTLSEEQRRTRPFEASMLDGIDIRETIRNWHEGRLYVREQRQIQGRVGSVVVVFDYDQSDDQGEAYPWRMSWLGEHDQESDMAFYATEAGEVMAGPGISKCEYGGFMLTYPPLRLYDPWRDPFFSGARSKAERLLMAGIDYSEEKLIAYIAPQPPPDRMKSLANLYGKKVVYLPLGQFSPSTLQKMRTFHVLDGHQARAWADDYIVR